MGLIFNLFHDAGNKPLAQLLELNYYAILIPAAIAVRFGFIKLFGVSELQEASSPIGKE